MVLGDTDGVLPAGDGGAGVDAGGGLAGQLSRAVLVLPALHSGGRANTAGKVGISSGSSGTLALVAPVLIDTPGLGAAGVLQALVNIRTASERVSSVTSLTETLGRVGGRTVSVNTTLEPLAGTLTLAAVSGVSEEWRGTDTLAGLHTLLVGTTVSVSAALDLVGRADSVVGISGGSQGTDAAEGPDLVLAESPEAAWSGGVGTLVDVGTAPVRLSGEPCGTGAVGDSARDTDTLGSLGAVSFVLTSLDDTGASGVQLVRRLTATVSSIAGEAGEERVSIVSSRTLAVKTSRQVLAEGVTATDGVLGRGEGTLVNISAET